MAIELKGLTKRSEDYSKWYNELVVKADLAEQADVRGCMVIKPYGYAIWEKMQRVLDDMFKETGVQNAYFPLLIPKSFLSREAEHVEGFAKECAVVTHYRLKTNETHDGVIVDPEAKLEEELIVRPTSETIIWNTYKNWIHSYRDLPILCNQWCNVMRWEMRTRLFLRTSEFLWQEGHTAHATREEAEARAKQMLKVYADFAEQYMAVPVVQGVKSETERFAGALDTYTIEAMMQDGKALQSGTSHFLGQNFGKAFDVQFTDKDGKLDYAWATSWGVSTRLMGALIMTHSDDNGLVLPPALAPIQVVIVPIYKGADQLEAINNKIQPLIDKFKKMGISVKYDNADNKRPGFKFADYELKGVPVRLVMGGRDLENNTVEVMRRDTLEKETVSFDGIETYVQNLLDEIQKNIFKKAKDFRDAHIYECDDYEEFKQKVKNGGFFLCHWDGTAETEAKIKADTQATIRCVPYMFEQTEGVDMVSGKPSKCRVLIARSY
ncbi:MAG: proline--tRNA ligase [Bacteroidaceae bacterium]|jgi:prolyl-tRNA synthetase|uniref:proline--tRNA ligase n=1 Tax=unclassified Bacteroides TaxID=2646097 RepID=UPI0004E100EB|nr:MULTISPECIES: proline--tRNA ligase [unclassified Bacteroides]MBP3246205.1 proline--tRNA ligase [Bacteroidaceae bacterium]SDF29253.1 prolyl-tRNA synthetase [Bacteroidales bacterium KHT7]MBQ3873756.1 proline--tRNA ligase [Bacteroidaceae bacterium]MBQ7484593.1 proline--tRNA ligase [Bacteroidaceae bacterium]MBR6367463.1 proline--tRNA ligase [Bacteroidaceae bacterium]